MSVTFSDNKKTANCENSDATAAYVLSPREREVLALLAGGLTGSEVAKQLWLSPETVRTHVRNAMKKLGARTRVQAVVLAIRKREISDREALGVQSASEQNKLSPQVPGPS